MATKILVRRGNKADLTETTLDEGELGFSKDLTLSSHELGLYVGSDAVQDGYIKINSTKNIEYEGNALTSTTDTNNLEEAIENIDSALKVEQNNVDTLQSNVNTLTTNLSTKSDTGHTHLKADITDFAHTHTKSEITDFTHTHTEADITDLDKYTQTQTDTLLDAKANLDSPALEGTPTAPTPTQNSHIANKGYVDTAINNAVLGDVVVEWVLEGEQSGEVLPSGFNVFIDDIAWDFNNYDYKVVFDFETTGEDNDEPYLRFNGLTSSSTNYNYLTKTTSSENDGVTVASLENTSLIKFGAKLPINSVNLGQTQYQGEFIIRRSVLGAPTPGTPNNNYSVRGFASVTAASAPVAGFLGFPVESIFVGNFWTGTTGFTSIDIYSGISAGASDYAKARIYKRAK
jgi:hypothetical protein